MSCKARVSDHTDWTDCGEPTLPGHSYCIPHRVERLKYLAEQERVAMAEAKRSTAAYMELLEEGQ